VPPIHKQKNYKCTPFNYYKLFLKGKPMTAEKKKTHLEIYSKCLEFPNWFKNNFPVFVLFKCRLCNYFAIQNYNTKNHNLKKDWPTKSLRSSNGKYYSMSICQQQTPTETW